MKKLISNYKISFSYLFGSLLSLILAFLVVSGLLQKIIYFENIINEIIFFSVCCLMFVICLIFSFDKKN